MNNESLKYICIFGGGAIRGASYVGVVKALKELGINPSTIAGSSVGAVVGSLVSVGYSETELEDIFENVNFELFKDIHFGLGQMFGLSKGEIFLDWLRELIEKKFYGSSYKKGENPPVTFANLDKDFIVIATDLTNFKCKEFSKYSTPDFEIAYAVRISSSMPGFFKPAEEDGALLVDGDLQKSLPMWRLSKKLCPDDERILEFRLEGDFEGKGKNPINFVNTVYSCVTSISTDFIIDTYGKRDKFDYVKINTGAVIVVDFNLAQDQREKLMQIGYLQTMEYFNKDLVEKKKNIKKSYDKIFDYIKKIHNYFSKAKYKYVKNELGNLYMNISETKKYIDMLDYNLIEDFKNQFLNNFVAAPLFGVAVVKDKKNLQDKIDRIKNKFENKIYELNDYILSHKN